MKRKNITGILLAAVLLLAGCAGGQSTGPVNETKDPVADVSEEESIKEEAEEADLPDESTESEEIPEPEPEEEEEEEEDPEIQPGLPSWKIPNSMCLTRPVTPSAAMS